jgi:regulation of enolase protein 1 (concanavalin A-like superfamily)
MPGGVSHISTSHCVRPLPTARLWRRQPLIGHMLHYFMPGTAPVAAALAAAVLGLSAAAASNPAGSRPRGTAMRTTIPRGWTAANLGGGKSSGSLDARAAGGVMTLRGSGSDFWGAADSGSFVSRSIRGDFQITVRVVAGPTPTNEWAKAGLMVRDSLEPGARNVHLDITPAHGIEWQWRAVAGGETENLGAVPPDGWKLPVFLRLSRQGDRLSAEYSVDDGKSFQPLGVPATFAPPLPLTLGVGLAVTARDENKITEARFSDLRIQKR